MKDTDKAETGEVEQPCIHDRNEFGTLDNVTGKCWVCGKSCNEVTGERTVAREAELNAAFDNYDGCPTAGQDLAKHGLTHEAETSLGKAPSVKFGASFIGCVIDGSADSADYINERTIDFAKSYGFKTDGDLGRDDDEDYSQILSEEGDRAVSFLNDQELLPYCSFYFDDNSLFYAPSLESAKEDLPTFNDASELDFDGPGEWLHVNDHGNVTLYVRDDKGEDKEIWGIV